MTTMDTQRGASLLFWVFCLVVVGFLLMLCIKLSPVYYKGFVTRSVVKSVALEMSNQNPNEKELWEKIDNHLYINSVSGVTKEHFVYSKNRANIEFGLDYEIRVPVIANLDAIAKFDQHQTIGASE